MISIFLFTVANLFLISSAYILVHRLQLRQLLDRVLISFTLVLSIIIASQLIAGIVLNQYNAFILFLISIGMGLLLILLSRIIHVHYSHPILETDDQPHQRIPQSWIWGISIGIAVVLLMQFIESSIMPPSDWDSLYYHLSGIASWIQAGHIGKSSFTLWSNVYPQNAELFYAWLMIFFHHDYFVRLGQVVFSIIGALATAGLGRWIGLRRSYAYVAGGLFLLTPIVMAQAITNYVDLSFAAMFLVAFYFLLQYIKTQRFTFILLSGIASGIALGMKSSGVVYIGMIGLLLLIHLLIKHPWKQSSLSFVCFTSSLLLFGSFWYIRTWYTYGNPIYPFTVSFMGQTLFHGTGTIKELIMGVNTPTEFLGKPSWKQILLSWSYDWQPQLVNYDQRWGGNGMLWLYLEFPALVGFAIYSFLRLRMKFYFFVLPFIIIFFAQPSAWWSRYTLFIIALGAISLAFFLEKLSHYSFIHRIVQISCFALLAVGIGYFIHDLHPTSVLKTAVKLPSSQRTIANFVYPEYKFVDQLPADASIAIWYDRFAYPFFGRHLEHHVYLLDEKTEQKFFKFLQGNNIDYLYTLVGANYDKWAQDHPEKFQMLDSIPNYHLYKLQKGVLP